MCECVVPEFCRTATRTSKRERRCEECRVHIGKGEVYHAVTGKWDGHLDGYDICLFCESLRQEAQRADVCDCIAFGELKESLWEEFGYNDEDCLLLNRLFGGDPLCGTELDEADVEALEGRAFVGRAA